VSKNLRGLGLRSRRIFAGAALLSAGASSCRGHAFSMMAQSSLCSSSLVVLEIIEIGRFLLRCSIRGGFDSGTEMSQNGAGR